MSATPISSAADMFAGQVVFITGGGDGIGKTTAEHFLARGAHVALLDLDISHAPPECLAFQGSVTDDAAVRTAVDAVAARHGRIDILVNNAGISFYGSVEDGTLDDWTRVIDVNLLGVVRASRAALPHLRKSRNGTVVNIASALASMGMAKRALYCATKGAVQSLSWAMAADLLADGIRVNCVNPGATDTAFVRTLAVATGNDKEFATRQATGRMVRPDEVAQAVLYLARPDATSTTGSVLTVEAGFSSILK